VGGISVADFLGRAFFFSFTTVVFAISFILYSRKEMPYSIIKEGKKWFVITTRTGKRHSEKGLTKKMAEAQLAALRASLFNAARAGSRKS